MELTFMSNYDDILHILIIDDDPVDVTAVKREFEKKFKNVVFDVAIDGEEGFSFLTENDRYPAHEKYHFILLDINIPKFDGIELLERLAKHHLNDIKKIIILTSSQANRDHEQASRFPILGYMTKPFEIDHFISLYKSLLGNQSWIN